MGHISLFSQGDPFTLREGAGKSLSTVIWKSSNAAMNKNAAVYS